MKKSELINIIKEVKQEILTEKLNWGKYLKELGYDARKFKKLDSYKHDYYMKQYAKSPDAATFEQNFLDDLEREVTKIAI